MQSLTNRAQRLRYPLVVRPDSLAPFAVCIAPAPASARTPNASAADGGAEAAAAAACGGAEPAAEFRHSAGFYTATGLLGYGRCVRGPCAGRSPGSMGGRGSGRYESVSALLMSEPLTFQ